MRGKRSPRCTSPRPALPSSGTTASPARGAARATSCASGCRSSLGWPVRVRRGLLSWPATSRPRDRVAAVRGPAAGRGGRRQRACGYAQEPSLYAAVLTCLPNGAIADTDDYHTSTTTTTFRGCTCAPPTVSRAGPAPTTCAGHRTACGWRASGCSSTVACSLAGEGPSRRCDSAVSRSRRRFCSQAR